MKFVRLGRLHNGRRPYVFSIDPKERVAFLAILQLYPVLDAAYHRISAKPGAAEQEWLEENIRQQQDEHTRQLRALFEGKAAFFKPDKEGFHFSLTAEQMEWLLRVLNDIRVGSWVRLGQPEMEAAPQVAAKNGRTHDLAAMELSGYFQYILLQALSTE